jgi:RNA polymerase primary sigma factor
MTLNPCAVLLQDTPDETALHQLLKQDLDNALLTLNSRECGVLRMRYGLDDGEEKTLEEIGQKFQVRPRLKNISD